jgi:Ni/Co efflux regulator RcnB
MSETLNSVSRRKVLTLVAAAFGAATMPLVLTTSDAEAQTAGMERRQERRSGRHERRETRRTGRQERRETRRGGGSDTTSGTAK